MTNPKLIILDEPTTGLDPHMRDVLWKTLLNTIKEQNGTVLLSTHYMDEVERYCDKVLLINNGVDEVFDTPKNILKNEGHQSINDFYLSQVGSIKRRSKYATSIICVYIWDSYLTIRFMETI